MTIFQQLPHHRQPDTAAGTGHHGIRQSLKAGNEKRIGGERHCITLYRNSGHSPRFFVDERALGVGMRTMLQARLDLLGAPVK
ncbi:MAG: hypothetical protein ABIP87_09055 [Thermomonas sp.]